MLCDTNSWYCAANPDEGVFGSQIDLLIARRDGVINLCEMKYSQSEYMITLKDDQSFRRKVSDFLTVTGAKYAVYPTLVTTYGLVDNSYSMNVQSVITMDNLFEK